MLAIVVSRADEASTHIGEQLLDAADWTETVDDDRSDADGGGTVYRTDGAELREFDGPHLELEHAATAFDDPELLVFASKHAGETGQLLTAHHTGNFGEAEYGGESGRFARAAPNAHRAVLDALADHAPDGYDVGMECTHHGPTEVGVPSMFVEVGSAEPQWRDPGAARAAARAILDLRGVPADAPDEGGRRRQLVGFGGGHYVPQFERVARETDWAVGHIGADWCLSDLSEWVRLADDTSAGDIDDQYETVLGRAVAASGAEYALVTGGHPDLAETVESLGYRVVGERFVRETTGVPLGFVESVEAAVGPVDDGLRFGEAATDPPDDWDVVTLPEELVSEATGIDAERVRDWFAANTLAFGTTQQGTVVTGPAVLAAGAERSAVVDALADVLRERYDSVERDGDGLRAREQRFDPELAETLGIPEGPKYGKLSAGRSVEVDGREIEPETVHSERIRRFTL
ncbi:D-aminoacyl-tRNA deacylase [Haloarcula laminariae]|uniref:D-aminoacyl-tRNA deacylase n=1 Tax=Haloarcula laminariae TaxID=2961577 RepID=UPI0021C7D3D0|nr:D-aminoacyl-tRNA deacylase [Halomicroarcula laminariae]